MSPFDKIAHMASPGSTPAKAAPAPASVGVLDPDVGVLADRLDRLVGLDRARQIAEQQLGAQYGASRRAEGFMGPLLAAWGRLTPRQIRVDWGDDAGPESWFGPRRMASLGREAVDGILEDVVAATSSPAALAAWRAGQKSEASRAGSAPAFVLPSTLPMEGDECIETFQAALAAWMDDQPQTVLARIGGPIPAWGCHPLVAEARKTLAGARKAAALAAARESVGRWARDGGGWPDCPTTEELTEAGRCPALWAHPAWVAAHGGRYRMPDIPAPAAGWAASYGLPHAPALVACGLPEAIARLGELIPAGMVYGARSRGRCAGQVIYPDGRVDDSDDSPDGLLPTTPSRGGWWAPSSRRWCGPDIYAVWDRVTSAPRSTGVGLDVSRVIQAWGRHPTEGYGRLLWEARNCRSIVIGADDVVVRWIDDLAALQAARVGTPVAAFWLDARVVATQSGGLRIVRGAETPQALVTLEASEQSHGRHGRSGRCIAPAQGQTAPCLSYRGRSAGGGQAWSRIVAVVTPGRPLLVDDGRGVRMHPDGVVDVVPGLGTGAPGQPCPVD